MESIHKLYLYRKQLKIKVMKQVPVFLWDGSITPLKTIKNKSYENKNI